jgi:hypothetical protein
MSDGSAPVSRVTALRNRCRRRAIDPASGRPGELLRAFFLVGLLFIAASGVAALAYSISGEDWLHWLALHLLFLGGSHSSCSAPDSSSSAHSSPPTWRS